MTTISETIPYDPALVRAMAGATAYPPLPTEPGEGHAPAYLASPSTGAKPQTQPNPAPKPAYEPLPREVDTRENQPVRQQ